MGRPRMVSDEAILDAARSVLLRRGHGALTLTEIGDEVGLSRAAISLRFQNLEQLTARVVAHSLENFRRILDTIPASRCGDGLIRLAATIGDAVKAQTDLVTLLQVLPCHACDRVAALERQHNDMLLRAISRRMPETALPHDDAVSAYAAHLTANILRMRAAPPDCAKAHVVEQTRKWLILAGVPFEAAVG